MNFLRTPTYHGVLRSLYWHNHYRKLAERVLQEPRDISQGRKREKKDFGIF